MKFTFLIPPVLSGKREVERVFGCNYGAYPIPNIFMLYCASIVRKFNEIAVFIDAPLLKWQKDEFINFICKDDSVAYVFYTVNLSKKTDLIALDIIKNYKPDLWVIFMGPSPTYGPEDYLKLDKTIVIRGETEETFESLLPILINNSDRDFNMLRSCTGISYKLNGEIVHNPKRDPIANIDKLLFPARDLTDKNKYFNPKLGVTPFTVLLTSRGCSFRCRYCVPNSLSFARELEFRNGLGSWRKPAVTIRSFDNVLEELILLKKEGYKSISVLDDQFIWDGEREIKIALAMGRLGFVWGCLSRGDMITEDIARAFSQTNCQYVDIGIESFCQEILNDIKKGTTVQKLYNGIELLKKYNVPFKLNILFGASPLETEQTIKHTLKVAKELQPYSIMVGICNPFPGTEFWEIAKRENWLLTPDYLPVDVQKESTIRYPHLGRNDLEREVKLANIKFFFRPKFIIKNLIKIKQPKVLIKTIKSLMRKMTDGN
jgi:radical SAM superfamily enzyme YgiQ (UPF0313 family)